MTGDSNNVPSVDPGIIQLVCRGIFEMIKKETAKDGNQKVFAGNNSLATHVYIYKKIINFCNI